MENKHCHRVTTQLQLINIIINSILLHILVKGCLIWAVIYTQLAKK